MITQIDIKELRTLKNISIPFKPLTLLTGENGTGKTTILTILDCERGLLAGRESRLSLTIPCYFDDYDEEDFDVKIHTLNGIIDWQNDTHPSKMTIKPVLFDFWEPHYSDEYSQQTNDFLGYKAPVFVTPALYTCCWTVHTLLGSKHGDIILLENPENGLHPKLQTKIGKLIGETVSRGVQVIVETHSEYLVDGIGGLIRQGKLNPNDVQVNFLSDEGIKAPSLVNVINFPDLLNLGKQKQD